MPRITKADLQAQKDQLEQENALLRSQSMTIEEFSQYVTNGELGWGHKSAAGIKINAHKALSIPSYNRAVDIVSGKMSVLPCKVFQRKGDTAEVYSDHPAYRVLNYRFSHHVSAKQGIRTLFANAKVFGNSYARIYRNSYFEPVEMEILPSAETYLDHDQAGRLVYKSVIDDSQVTMLAANVFHLKGGISLDGLKSLDSLDLFKDSIGLSIAELIFASKYFANGGGLQRYARMAGALKSPEARERVKAQLAAFKGADKAHLIALFEEGMELASVGDSAAEAQLTDSRRHGLIDHANMAGCPHSRLGSDANTSYGSLQADQIAFLSDMETLLVMFEEEANLKLLTTAEYESGDVYVEFDRMANDRNDPDSMAARLEKQVAAGLITENEARKLQNKPLYDHPYADLPRSMWTIVEAQKARESAEKMAAEQPKEVVEKPTKKKVSTKKDKPNPPQERSKLELLTAKEMQRWFKRCAKASESDSFEFNDHTPVITETLDGVVEAESMKRSLEVLQGKLEVTERSEWKNLFEEEIKNASNWAQELYV